MSQTRRDSVDPFTASAQLQGQRGSVASTHSLDLQTSEAFDQSPPTPQDGGSSAFDYFGAATGQVNITFVKKRVWNEGRKRFI